MQSFRLTNACLRVWCGLKDEGRQHTRAILLSPKELGREIPLLYGLPKLHKPGTPSDRESLLSTCPPTPSPSTWSTSCPPLSVSTPHTWRTLLCLLHSLSERPFVRRWCWFPLTWSHCSPRFQWTWLPKWRMSASPGTPHWLSGQHCHPIGWWASPVLPQCQIPVLQRRDVPTGLQHNHGVTHPHHCYQLGTGRR